MRRNLIIPRILKINWVNGLAISVVFNNGESRIIDFRKVLNKIGVEENTPASILFNPDEFKKVELQNNTLSWDIEQFITLKDKNKMKVPFEIGADILFQNSEAEKPEFVIKIGQLIREERLKSGLNQQELAMRSGTTRNYISRIENDRSDIELATLRKIIETGLGKHLEIVIKSTPSRGHHTVKGNKPRRVKQD
jgi:DNA-binding XRE family transcriptional regulator